MLGLYATITQCMIQFLNFLYQNLVVSFIFTSVVDQKPVLLQYLVPDTKDLSIYLPSIDFIVPMLRQNKGGIETCYKK